MEPKNNDVTSTAEGQIQSALLVFIFGSALGLTDWIFGGGSTPIRSLIAAINGIVLLLCIVLLHCGWVRLAINTAALVFVIAFGLHFGLSGELFQLAVLMLVPIVMAVIGGARVGLLWLIACGTVMLSLSAGLQLGMWEPPLRHLYARGWFREAMFLAYAMIGSAVPVMWLSKHAAHVRLRELASDRRLQSQIARFQSATHSAYDLILEADSDWNVLWAAGELPASHLDAESILGTNLRRQVTSDHRHLLPVAAKDVEHISSEGRLINCEFKLQLGEDARWIRMTGGTFWDHDGVRWICGLQSIDQEIADRQKLADVARLESLAELSGGLAHDFNNLLTIISIYADMLEDSAPTRAIRSAQRQASELIGSLMSFARRQEVKFECVDVHELLRDAEVIVRGLVPNSIAVVFNLEAERHHAEIDEVQFRQSLVNMVTNARDAIMAHPQRSTAGAITISSTTAKSETRPGEHDFVLNVIDNGSGMSDETRTRAFEPFYTTKQRSRGTGLGLSLVHGIVKQWGGWVQIDSSTNHGTKVSIGFPLSTQPAATPLAPPASKIAADNPLGVAPLIMVVEDEMLLLNAMKATLTACGFRVLEFADARQASTAPNRLEIDLLVTDVSMPGMSGPQLADALRSEHADLPVLFMSGYTSDCLPLHEPATRFLSKPFRQDRLVLHINHLLAECRDRTRREN
ncbi:MAG: ATP-binding protein [Pirellulaceae bacterium]|nr:response regulator [Planctomycetales bacterium]